ncbi:hypothetical protein ACH82I_11605 [Brevibacterium sp. GP-SGM9]|uniref:hypothetical protein n=1 Tax=Brevibacterium sp. GP-SGM9 TaxID=3376990 RepID=UPI0039A6E14F
MQRRVMRLSATTRWILALLLLAVACFVLAPLPPFHDFAALLWGLALASLVAALIVAVRRDRRNK